MKRTSPISKLPALTPITALVSPSRTERNRQFAWRTFLENLEGTKRMLKFEAALSRKPIGGRSAFKLSQQYGSLTLREEDLTARPLSEGRALFLRNQRRVSKR